MIPKKEAIVALIKKAVTSVPKDVEEAIKTAFKEEDNDIAKIQLKNIIDNIELAKKSGLPLCQDTGIPLFYIKMNSSSKIEIKKLEAVIEEGIREATEEIPLRPNVVDPITRENKGNVGEKIPIFYYDFTEEDLFEITFVPKGAGSENMSRLAILNPSDGLEGVKKFVLNAVEEAGGRPCPPTIIGVGIGGTSDFSCFLAKKALLRPLDKRNERRDIKGLEEELFEILNDTGIGPMGLGGRTTVLGVHVECADTHTASLPVAVNFQCWAARRATLRERENEFEVV
ncbi:MAG: fumarate hydratase [Candidatus Methanolliviera sp. GoM_asphalt]|nr:MAG: fumarate hydratase [Candidatus Methanolliviera sp. GoM_asphalt]